MKTGDLYSNLPPNLRSGSGGCEQLRRHLYMSYSLPYECETELEMVWVEHEPAVAVECMLWLNWFCMTERSFELICPPSDVVHTTAMEVRVDWANVYGADVHANFDGDLVYYRDIRSGNADKTRAIITLENARVATCVKEHNATQWMRLSDDVVRQKLFAEMRQRFKGEMGYRREKGVERRSAQHRSNIQSAAQLCMSKKFFAERNVRCATSKVMCLTVYILKK